MGLAVCFTGYDITGQEGHATVARSVDGGRERVSESHGANECIAGCVEPEENRKAKEKQHKKAIADDHIAVGTN